MKLPTIISLLAFAAPLFAADTQKTIDDTRAVLDKWVDQRKELADRKAAWKVEKQAISESIQLYRRELDDLDKQIKAAEEQSSAADKERLELDDKEKLLRDAAKVVEDVIDGFETRLLGMVKAFPDPLQKKISEFVRRIPNEENRKDKSISERVQTLVAVLGEVDKFNNSVTSDTEFRKNASGGDIAVDTLYLGLGQAFFVAKEGDYAGVGRPQKGEWTWAENSALAPKIREALAMYRNAKPADFVGLEVTIK